MIRLLKEIKKLVVGSVLTLSGAIMMTSAENIAVVGMAIGIIGLLFLLVSLFSGSKLASYYKEDDGTEQESKHDTK